MNSYRFFDDADIPIVFSSRLWINLTSGDIRHRVDDISKRFTGAGWKRLPQELVDEILDYLLDDLDTLKACSLTCRCFFGATRPLIHSHQRLVCLESRPEYPKPKRSLFSSSRRDPKVCEQLIDADRLALLHYARHLTIKAESGALGPGEHEKLPPIPSVDQQVAHPYSGHLSSSSTHPSFQ